MNALLILLFMAITFVLTRTVVRTDKLARFLMIVTIVVMLFWIPFGPKENDLDILSIGIFLSAIGALQSRFNKTANQGMDPTESGS